MRNCAYVATGRVWDEVAEIFVGGGLEVIDVSVSP
jgi:hypothetical protein